MKYSIIVVSLCFIDANSCWRFEICNKSPWEYRDFKSFQMSTTLSIHNMFWRIETLLNVPTTILSYCCIVCKLWREHGLVRAWKSNHHQTHFDLRAKCCNYRSTPWIVVSRIQCLWNQGCCKIFTRIKVIRAMNIQRLI